MKNIYNVNLTTTSRLPEYHQNNDTLLSVSDINLKIDSKIVKRGDLILVKDEDNNHINGIYKVIDPRPWQLKRVSISIVDWGTLLIVKISEGLVYSNTKWGLFTYQGTSQIDSLSPTPYIFKKIENIYPIRLNILDFGASSYEDQTLTVAKNGVPIEDNRIQYCDKAFEDALQFLNYLGGGELFVPNGTYKLSNTIKGPTYWYRRNDKFAVASIETFSSYALSEKITILGESMTETKLWFDFSQSESKGVGDGIRVIWEDWGAQNARGISIKNLFLLNASYKNRPTVKVESDTMLLSSENQLDDSVIISKIGNSNSGIRLFRYPYKLGEYVMTINEVIENYPSKITVTHQQYTSDYTTIRKHSSPCESVNNANKYYQENCLAHITQFGFSIGFLENKTYQVNEKYKWTFEGYSGAGVISVGGNEISIENVRIQGFSQAVVFNNTLSTKLIHCHFHRTFIDNNNYLGWHRGIGIWYAGSYKSSTGKGIDKGDNNIHLVENCWISGFNTAIWHEGSLCHTVRHCQIENVNVMAMIDSCAVIRYENCYTEGIGLSNGAYFEKNFGGNTVELAIENTYFYPHVPLFKLFLGEIISLLFNGNTYEFIEYAANSKAIINPYNIKNVLWNSFIDIKDYLRLCDFRLFEKNEQGTIVEIENPLPNNYLESPVIYRLPSNISTPLVRNSDETYLMEIKQPNGSFIYQSNAGDYYSKRYFGTIANPCQSIEFIGNNGVSLSGFTSNVIHRPEAFSNDKGGFNRYSINIDRYKTPLNYNIYKKIQNPFNGNFGLEVTENFRQISHIIGKDIYSNSPIGTWRIFKFDVTQKPNPPQYDEEIVIFEYALTDNIVTKFIYFEALFVVLPNNTNCSGVWKKSGILSIRNYGEPYFRIISEETDIQNLLSIEFYNQFEVNIRESIQEKSLKFVVIQKNRHHQSDNYYPGNWMLKLDVTQYIENYNG